MKSGFISIIGRPNTGKSTLLNMIIGTKVAIATPKPQTTRNTIRGIFTDNIRDKQMVFLDTPGIHMPKNKLGEKLVASSRRSMRDVDLVLLLVDERSKLEEEDYCVNSCGTLLVFTESDRFWKTSIYCRREFRSGESIRRKRQQHHHRRFYN